MREPLLGVAVGKKGVGKSYTTDKMLHNYIQGNPSKGVAGRKALILDVNDEYQHVRAIALKDIVKFSAHPTIELRRVRPFMPDGRRMTLDKIAETLFIILEQYRGGLLLIEDINRYVSDHLPKDIEGAICTNRHVDLDIVMHFQSIGRITTKYLNLDEMHLMGFVDKKKINLVIDEYIMMNQSKLISAYLKMRNSKNKPMYTVDTAIAEVKNRLLREYIEVK